MSIRTMVISVLAITCAAMAGCTPVGAGRPVVTRAGDSLPAAPAATSTQVPAAAGSLPGWRTYGDAAMGYSISLPQGADFRAGTSPAGVYTARVQFALPGVPGYQGMVVRVEPNPGGQGIEAILARLYQAATAEQAPAELAAQAQSLTVSGLAAARVVTGSSAEGSDFTIIIPYRDKVYMIAPAHDLAHSALSPQAQALFDQILASFRVTQ